MITPDAHANSEPEPRSDVPGAWVVLALGLAASPVIAFIQASQFLLQRHLERGQSTLSWELIHLLPPWVSFAVSAAAIVPFVRRFPLPQAGPRGRLLRTS